MPNKTTPIWESAAGYHRKFGDLGRGLVVRSSVHRADVGGAWVTICKFLEAIVVGTRQKNAVYIPEGWMLKDTFVEDESGS